MDLSSIPELLANAVYWSLSRCRHGDLGQALKGDHPQALLIRELRKASLQWGMITNGIRWRLCCATAAAPYEAYLEADVDALLQDSDLAGFLLFHRFFGGEAFGIADQQIGLVRLLAASDRRTEAINDTSRDRSSRFCRSSASALCWTRLPVLIARSWLQAIYQNAIYLLYRILFLFYAEARDLLPLDYLNYRAVSL